MWQIAQIYTFDKALVGRWFSQKLVLCENNAKRSGSTLPSCPLRRIYGAGWGNIKLGMSTIYKTHVNYFQQFKKNKSFDCTCGWWLCHRKDPLYWWQWFCVKFWKQKWVKKACLAVKQFAKKKKKKTVPQLKSLQKERPQNKRICKTSDSLKPLAKNDDPVRQFTKTVIWYNNLRRGRPGVI